MITNLGNCGLGCERYSAYDYDGYSLQELLCQFYTKINENVDLVNSQEERIQYLLDQGVSLEVAKKIDSMVTDGSLGNLINDKLLVEINKKIDKNTTDIGTKASNTDLAKERGRIDQLEEKPVTKEAVKEATKEEIQRLKDAGQITSVTIGNESIERKQIKDVVSSNIYDRGLYGIDGRYVSTSTGNVEVNSLSSYAKIPVKPDTVYSIWNHISSTMASKVFFQNSDSQTTDIVQLDANVRPSFFKDQSVWTLTTKSTTKYLCINTKLTTNYDVRDSLKVVEGVKMKDDELISLFKNSFVDEGLRKDYKELIESINPSDGNIYNYQEHMVEGSLAQTNGTWSGAKGWNCAVMDVSVGEYYSIFFPSQVYDTSSRGKILFLKNSEVISSIEQKGDALKSLTSGKKYLSFQIPPNINKMAFTLTRPESAGGFLDDSKTAKVFKKKEITDSMISGELKEIFGYKVKEYDIITQGNNPIYKKKWLCMGDSLTEHNQRATQNYHDFIAERTGVININKGMSGTGYKRQDDQGNAFYQRIAKVSEPFDIITVFGSGNDIGSRAPLGNVTDSGTTTICGCFNKFLEELFKKQIAPRLGIITPTPWQGSTPQKPGNGMEKYSEKLVELCRYHGIPCLDLYHSSGLRPDEDAYRKAMYSKDNGNGVHPDEKGQEYISYQIQQFVESL